MDRIENCRRLLGTATALFLESKDPISVHTLSATALEHAEFLAQNHTGSNFKTHVMSTFPDMTERDLKKLRNKYWRVIKHSHDYNKQPFDVEKHFEDFDDSKNDAVLFYGWYDFMKCGHPIPLAAQVFQLWFFRVYPHSLNPEKGFDFARFENLRAYPRFRQKQVLCEEIDKAFQWKEVINHPMTDARPLVLH